MPPEAGKVAAMSPLAAKLSDVCALSAPDLLATVANNRANNNANRWRTRA
jgi:hypothetical protein